MALSIRFSTPPTFLRRTLGLTEHSSKLWQVEYDSTVGTIYNPNGIWLRMTTPVGSYARNPWGLYDTIGNVLKWCRDWYGTYPTGSVADPQGPATGSSRVVRGGSWGRDGQYCRSAFRDAFYPTNSINIIGFRAVLAQGQP